MRDSRLPRVVLVTRKTPLRLLLEQHGTLAQARFYLASRGQDIAGHVEADARFEAALSLVLQQVPAEQRRVRVDRADLDRFLFAPDDVVLVVGQDGLVANVAKYLGGQLTIGVNPDPERFDGVLCPHHPSATAGLLAHVVQPSGSYRVQERTMAVATREDGQRLYALNDVFIGHRTHQSARYRLHADGRSERQSSSGIICSTGTGATGWARSITGQRRLEAPLPAAEDARLAWFVREPFPSVATGTSLDFGLLERGQMLAVASEMGTGGVAFADGIETDTIEFLDGHSLTIGVADRTLRLVV